MVYQIRTCDMCHLGGETIVLGQRGVAMDRAPSLVGWEEREFGDICPECIAEEKVEALDDLNVEHGPGFDPFESTRLSLENVLASKDGRDSSSK